MSESENENQPSERTNPFETDSPVTTVTTQAESTAAQKKQKRKADTRAIILTVLLILAVIIILLLCLRGCQNNTPPTDDSPTYIEGGDPIPEDVGIEKDVGSTHLPAYGMLYFKANTKKQTVVLENPGENSCLVRISLTLADGTTVYQSGLVKPGYYTEPIKLKAPMKRGVYRDVTLRYECFSEDEAHTPMNGATSKLDITVK